MDQSIHLQMVPEQSTRVSPTLIMVNQLLALSSLELQHSVLAELEQNPALDSIENTTCASCGAGVSGRYCPVCMHPLQPPVSADSVAAHAMESSPGTVYDDGFDPEDYHPRSSGYSGLVDEDFDPLTLVASESSVTDQLLTDLKASLPARDYFIAEYLIGNLDEHGFLTSSIETITTQLGIESDRVEQVLQLLQRVGPAGVGARNLRECMLMQLEEIRAQGRIEVRPLVEKIISDHLTELGEHKYTYLSQLLGTTYESVVGVRDFIKKHMQPRPLEEAPQGRAWRSPSPTRFIMPDVIIREKDGELEVEVVETYRFSLRVNPLYERLAAESIRLNGTISDSEREHIKRYVNRSKLFISNINQRRETMFKITSCLAGLQDDFIRHGVRHLRPLTRAQVAQYLGIHESTVSRATADKYVMLPDKHVIPFSDFFSASLSAKDVIKELITGEGRPMTDKQIVDYLLQQGIRVARRTVTKYRNQLGILPSTFR